VAELRFRGRLGLGRIVPPKETPVDPYAASKGSRLVGGSAEIVLTVARPEEPTPPAKPRILDEVYEYNYRDDAQDPGAFVEPDRDDEETDRKYASRVAAARRTHEARVARHQAHLQKVAEAQATYDAQLAAHHERVLGMAHEYLSYAQLPGLAAVLGGLEVEVRISPTAGTSRMLPGFVEALLAVPEGPPAPSSRRRRLAAPSPAPAAADGAEQVEAGLAAGDDQ
jgi:hypothetical protein